MKENHVCWSTYSISIDIQYLDRHTNMYVNRDTVCQSRYSMSIKILYVDQLLCLIGGELWSQMTGALVVFEQTHKKRDLSIWQFLSLACPATQFWRMYRLVWAFAVYQCDKWAATWQNQQNGMCAQRRLKSAWASAQSDQSLQCAQGVAKNKLSSCRQRRLWSG